MLGEDLHDRRERRCTLLKLLYEAFRTFVLANDLAHCLLCEQIVENERDEEACVANGIQSVFVLAFLDAQRRRLLVHDHGINADEMSHVLLDGTGGPHGMKDMPVERGENGGDQMRWNDLDHRSGSTCEQQRWTYEIDEVKIVFQAEISLGFAELDDELETIVGIDR